MNNRAQTSKLIAEADLLAHVAEREAERGKFSEARKLRAASSKLRASATQKARHGHKFSKRAR